LPFLPEPPFLSTHLELMSAFFTEETRGEAVGETRHGPSNSGRMSLLFTR
jgi:hypothetical protein